MNSRVCKGGSLIILVLQIRKIRHGDSQGLVQVCTAVSGEARVTTQTDRVWHLALSHPLTLLPLR